MLSLTLNRPHRQALATLALVALTVAPTGYVAWTAWRINRPGYLREVEREIGRRLGLQVALDGVRHPRPGVDVFRGVELRQEEPRGQGGQPRAEIARAETVRIRRGDGQMALEVEGLHLRGESPKGAMAQVSALLQRAGEAESPRVSLSARDCSIELGQGAGPEVLHYRFRDVVGSVQADRSAPTVTVSYRAPGDEPTTRCELTLTRDRRGEAVHTRLVFKTMEGLPLPAGVLDPFFDSADWLGPSARFRGALTLHQAGSSDWEAEFQGSLEDVDLAALIGRRFPGHRMSGLARVEITSARWAERPGAQGFGWVEADGKLATGPGTIGMGLLHALKSEMKFQVPPRLDGYQGDLPFQGLGLTFAMTGEGELRLGGGLGAEFPPGAVLVDASQFAPLASAPEGAANVRGLIRTLFPTGAADPSVMVPDTAESRILRYLPAPPALAKGAEVMTN